MKLDEVVGAAANRRTFLKGAGMAGIALAAGATMIGSKFGANEQKVEAAAYSDVDILNFALNLEYLEAEFYAVATYGSTLKTLGILTADDESGPTTGGHRVMNFSASRSAFIATSLRKDEINHVQILRSALGSSAVKKPAINLDALGYGFNGVNDWMKLARQFEDVGVSAYLGAAPLISSGAYLAAAGAILGTEAQHSGSVRLVCIQAGVNSPAVDSVDVPPTNDTPYAVDKNGLSIPRTPMQVLNVVYAGGNCSGGLYPDGMNGGIVCQTQ